MAIAAREERIIFPKQVRKEIEDGERSPSSKKGATRPPSEFLTWVKAAKAAGAEINPDELIAKEVVTTVPKLVDSEGEGDQADPYVLALGVQMARRGHAVSVLTEDTRDRPPDLLSLASACGALDIPSIRIRLYLTRIGIRVA